MSETAETYDTSETSETSARAPFDPRKYLVKINGRGEYLEVKWRLAWLRDRHPDAIIETELTHLGETHAVFKARVAIPGGGVATGWGSEDAGDFRDFLEKAECVPLKSRILTRRGFVRFDEAIVGEDVLAYDPAADRCAWTPLREVKVYPSAPVVALTNRAGVRLECTPDHTWATAEIDWKGKEIRRLRQARALKTYHVIILAASAPGGDSPLTPQEAAIIGWLFTDGSLIRAPSGAICRSVIRQSKPERVAEIRTLVGSLASESVTPARILVVAGNRHESTCLPQHHFTLPAGVTRPLFAKAGIDGDADLPALATRLSVEAREAMFAAMMAADGDKRGTFAKKRRPGTMEAWRVLCALRGVAVTPLRFREHDMPTQRAKKRRHLSVQTLAIEDVGVRPVWCPTTDYGTWVMEQDGYACITGNTKSIGRALAALGFGTQYCQDHEFGAAHSWVVDSPVDLGKRRGDGEGRARASQSSGQGGNAGGPHQLMQATERQIKFIHAIGGEAGLTHDELQQWSEELYGMKIEALNRRDASALIEALQRRRNERQ